MAKQKSSKGKGSYAAYKTENRAYKNKIAKLEKHIRTYPNDEKAKENLERLKSPSNFKIRTRPHNPGTNKPRPQVHTYQVVTGESPKTAGEQLSELLGIPEPKYIRRYKKQKAPVTIKKRKNVEKP